MNRLNRKFGILAVVCLFGTLVFSQTLSYRTETFNVVPRGSNYSIQVGVFLTYDAEGGADPASWDSIETNLTYSFPDNTRLFAEPVIHGVGFPTEAHPGLQDPATTIPGTPALPGGTTNNVVENSTTPYAYLNTQTGETPFVGSETVTPTTPLQDGTARYVQTGLNPLLTTASLTEYLFLIIEFPISGSAGSFVFDVGFDTSAPINNALTLLGASLFASTTDGQITVFAPVNCSGATVADNVGTASGASINIDYLSPSAGGAGGDLTFTMPHAVPIDRFQVTGTDGYDSGAVAATGSPESLTINTSADGSPGTGADSVTYTIVYEVEFPPGSGTYVPGEPCTVDVTWNPPSCSLAWGTTPVAGSPTDLDVTMTNVMDLPPYGTLTSTATNWAADIDITGAPTSVTGGNQLNFDDVYTIAIVDANDIGTYSINPVTGPGVGNTSNCSVNLFLECPTNNTSCGTIVPALVLIGSTADIDYAGTNVADWVVTYDGTVQNLGPGTAGTATFGPVVGDALTVDVDATGFDPSGNPCNDLVTCTLDFEDPTCGNLTQTPDTQVTPVDPGTVVTLTVDTTNAINCEIDIEGTPTPMTPNVDPLTNYNVTWTYDYTAFYPTTLVVTVTNPDGDFTTCSWDIDVSCNAVILSVASPGTVGGVTIEGIGSAGGLLYDIYYSADCTAMAGDPLPAGATFAGSITLVGAGPNVVGNGPAGHAIQPDVCYYVTCGGSAVVLDRFGARTVPTLGEWGLIVFAVILMGAGIFFIRRRRTA